MEFEVSQPMNKFDLIILLIILIFMLCGYYKGLVKSILSVVQYFVVLFLSIALAPSFSKMLISCFNLDVVIVNWVKSNGNLFHDTISIINDELLQNIAGRIINIFAVVILFIILKILFSIIVAILNKIANLPIIGVVNKLGGLMLGMINGIFTVYLLILIIDWLPFERLNDVKMGLESSVFGSRIIVWLPEVASEVIAMVKTVV